MATAIRLTLKSDIMAKYFKRFSLLISYLSSLISFIFLLTSCQEGGDAGDLFGQWRMDGSDSKYVSFSGSVTLLKVLNFNELYGNFQHQGDSLFIQCYSEKGQKQDTLVVEQMFGLQPINNIRLRIVTLDSDKLVLDQNGHTWSFYKY